MITTALIVVGVYAWQNDATQRTPSNVNRRIHKNANAYDIKDVCELDRWYDEKPSCDCPDGYTLTASMAFVQCPGWDSNRGPSDCSVQRYSCAINEDAIDWERCVSWFDGCNQCGRSDNGIAFCTERYCSEDELEPAKCYKYKE